MSVKTIQITNSPDQAILNKNGKVVLGFNFRGSDENIKDIYDYLKNLKQTGDYEGPYTLVYNSRPYAPGYQEKVVGPDEVLDFLEPGEFIYLKGFVKEELRQPADDNSVNII